MTVPQLTLAVMTVDRQPSYIHQTLASMFLAEPRLHDLPAVHLLVGTNDAAYLDDYAHHELVRIHPLNDYEQTLIAPWSLQRRICHNYWRCLSLPTDARGGLCICEDDVIFRDHFLSHLAAAIEQIQATGVRNYALALSACYDFQADGHGRNGSRYCPYCHPFIGCQSMYYAAESAAELRNYVYEYGVEEYTRPSDILVRDLFAGRLYACVPSLVDHIGTVSTGVGCTGRSPSFYRPMPPREAG